MFENPTIRVYLSLTACFLVLYIVSIYLQLRLKHNLLKELNNELEFVNMSHKSSTNKILRIFDNLGIAAILKEYDQILKLNSYARRLPEDKVSELSHLSSQIIEVNEEGSKKIIALTGSRGASQNIVDHLMQSDLSHALLNFDYKIIHKNQKCSNLLGIDNNSTSYIYDFVDSSDTKRIKNMAKTAKVEGLVNGQEFYISKSKKNLSIHMNVITIESQEYIFCTILDITEYKMLKENMRQSQKMQAIGQLAGSIAHDFNNLLTAMIGFCDILLVDKKPSDKTFSEIMQIRQNANRAADLVKQLLAFSRKQVLSLKVVNVNNTIASLSGLLERLLGEHVNLNIDFGKNLNNVMADRVQLEQVIINLAVNARDAMDNQGDLFIKTYNVNIDKDFDDSDYYSPGGDDPVQDGLYTIVEIADTGSGIPKNIVENIFEPFFSTKDQMSGTGLGLATVYGIVKQIGGHIKFKTYENQGTCFYIFMRATIDEEENIEEDNNKTMSELLMNNTKDLGKILIVEDETPVRLFELHALTSKGYKVIDTGDAESAMNFLDIEGNNIKLVITDVVMPGIKGPEMADQIKEKYPHVKFIFTSGYAEEALSYFDENKHHFLAKPFSLQTLLTKVKEVLEEDD